MSADIRDDDTGAWPMGDPSLDGVPSDVRGWLAWTPWLAWVLPLGLYGWTALRGPGWIDAGMISTKVFGMDTSSWVNSHNLFHFVGRLWTLFAPPDDFATRLNLLCGLLGALTVHGIFLVGLRLTRNLGASALGALALTLSHSLWWHSTTLEVYTLNTALMAGIIWCVLRWDASGDRWYLNSALLLLGFGVSNHVLMGLFGFAFLALFTVRARRKELWSPRVILTGTALVLLGAQLWILVFLKDVNNALATVAPSAPEQSLDLAVRAFRSALHRTTGGHFQESMFPEAPGWRSQIMWRVNYLFTLAMNFPSVALPLGLVGAWSLWSKRRWVPATAAFFAVSLFFQALWSANYLIWDMYAFGLPVWVLFGLLVILGADHVWRLGPRARRGLWLLAPTLLVPIWLYPAVSRWGDEPGFWGRYFAQTRVHANLWSGPEYFANPDRRHYRTVLEVMEGYERVLPEGAHLWDDDGKGDYPFRFYWQQTLGRRTDVHVHSLFSPIFSDERASREARDLLAILATGVPVFVSSTTFPERRLLSHAWVQLEPGTTISSLAQLSEEDFRAGFPNYAFERVPVDEGGRRWIYRLVPRAGAPTRRVGQIRVEAEDLRGPQRPSHGTLKLAADATLFSGGRSLQWIGGEVGDSLAIALNARRAHTDAEVLLAPVVGPAGAVVEWRLAGQPWVRLDGRSTALGAGDEVSVHRGPLTPGEHMLEVRIVEIPPDVRQAPLVGLDYILLRAAEGP